MNVFKNLTMTFLMIFSLKCYSSEVKTIKCTYNYGNDSIIMGIGTINNKINIKRKINNLEYKYHIDNINNFNEVEDYVEISEKSGKKITYFLKCK